MFLSPLPPHKHFTQPTVSVNGLFFFLMAFITKRAEQHPGVAFRSIRGGMQRAKITALLTEKSCSLLCRIVLRWINLSTIDGEVVWKEAKRRTPDKKKEKQKDRKNRLDDKWCSAAGENKKEQKHRFSSAAVC